MASLGSGEGIIGDNKNICGNDSGCGEVDDDNVEILCKVI